MRFVLVGHRGSGKSTLGRMASSLMHVLFGDLDEMIENQTGRSPASWIEESEPQFRALEVETLKNAHKERVISVGAGIEEIPQRFAVIWVVRQEWESVARQRLPRIRPNVSRDEEIAWMKQTREPRYLTWADAKLELAGHESIERSATRLAALLDRLMKSCQTPLLKKSFWIGNPERLARQLARAEEVDAAGVEVRSDLFDPEYLAESKRQALLVRFSIRDADAIAHAKDFSNLDCDVNFSAAFLQHHNVTGALFSSHPVSMEMPTYPAGSLDVKWAPKVESFEDVEKFLSVVTQFSTTWDSVTALPQGSRWAWLRVILAIRQNRWNYVAGGCEKDISGALCWSDWAHYYHATKKAQLYGLIGEPVEHSLGPEFHNRFFASGDIDALYVAISVLPHELASAMKVLERLSFSGLSVTAPLKQALLSLPNVAPDECSQLLAAANTLRFDHGSWQATNTDLRGMAALLTHIEVCKKHQVLVVGKGGVSSVALRALTDRSIPFRHVGFREMDLQPDLWKTPWDIVINASGRDLAAGPSHKCRTFVDLRYGIRARNDGGNQFVAGEVFFEAQAREQLRFWGFAPEEAT